MNKEKFFSQFDDVDEVCDFNYKGHKRKKKKENIEEDSAFTYIEQIEEKRNNYNKKLIKKKRDKEKYNHWDDWN